MYQGKQSSRKKKQSSKICLVCGDSAIGYNFGVISCESCKAFFRRVGLLREKLLCPFKDNCVINSHSRKHCQKCRFDKCLKVGMKLELLEVRRNAKMRRWLEAKRNRCEQEKEDAARSTQNGAEDVNLLDNQKSNISKMMTVSSASRDKQSKDTQLICTKDSTINPSVEQAQAVVTQSNTNPNNTHCVDLTIPDTVRVMPVTRMQGRSVVPVRPHGCPLPLVSVDSYTTIQFSVNITGTSPTALFPSNWKYEKLQELRMANEEGWAVSGDVVHVIGGTCPSNFTLIDFNFMWLHLQNCVTKQYSRLSTLKKLPMDDQTALLMLRNRQIGLLRYAAKYDQSTGLMDISYPGRSHIHAGAMEKFAGGESGKCSKFRNMYPDKCRNDDLILFLTCSIALFNPGFMKLASHDAIEEERQVYLDLLKETWVNFCRMWVESKWTNENWRETDPETLKLVEFHIRNSN